MKKIRMKREDSKGIMVFSVLFIVLISFIGISLLDHTIIHTRIAKSRLNKIRETDQITQQLALYLHHFREKVFADQHHELFSPDSNYFNQKVFPEIQIDQVIIKNDFSVLTEDKTFFKKIKIRDSVFAFTVRGNHCLLSGVVIDILSGNIPITLIPFFLHKKIELPEETYLDENNIEIMDNQSFISGEIPVDFDVSSFLINMLKINGEILSWSKIREKFGFEISEEPIEEGLYFISKDNAVESLFIQGDIQRMIFSFKDEFQKVEFYFQDRIYELSYKPGTDCFYCWDERIGNDCRFLEKIVVNGNLWGLEQGNDPAFGENTNIILLVSGQTMIKTSLETKNLDLQKIKLNHLTLIGGHHALFNPENDPAKITVESPGKTDIQISIMVNGTFENKAPELQLSGSLYANEIENQGNIKINHLRSGFNSGTHFQALDFIFISDFFIDFIEEVSDAEN